MADAKSPRRSLILGGLGLTAAALIGCTKAPVGEPAPSPSPSERRYRQPVSLPRFPISSAPAWGSEQVGLATISDIIFTRHVAVITGSTKDSNTGGQMIKVVEAQTGRVLWSKETLKPINKSGSAIIRQPDIAVVDDGRDGLLLVHYFSSECTSGMCPPGGVEHSDEEGVAALSLADGSVRWWHPIIPSVKAGTSKARRLSASSMQLISGLARMGLVITGPASTIGAGNPAAPDAVRTIALDPKTGKQAWSAKNALAQRIVNDLVLATDPVEGPAGQRHTVTGGPLALDLLTGKEVWNRSSAYANSILTTTSGGLVIIQVVEDGRVTGQHLLRLVDGRTHLSLPATTPIMVGDEVGALFASYSIYGGGLVTLAPDEKIPIAAAHAPTDVFMVAALHDGYILATKDVRDSNTNVTVAFDRSGNELSGPIPGTLSNVNNTALVTHSKSGSAANGYDQFSVYLMKP